MSIDVQKSDGGNSKISFTHSASIGHLFTLDGFFSEENGARLPYLW